MVLAFAAVHPLSVGRTFSASAPYPRTATCCLVTMREAPPVIDGRLVLAASGADRGIGYDGDLPWPRLPTDLRHFRTLTSGSPVLMGATTYTSLPTSVRPLPNRLNVVLSSRSRAELQVPDSVLVAGSFEAAAELLSTRGLTTVYVIGGQSVFDEAMRRPEWSRRVHYTQVDTQFPADRVFSVDLDAAKDFELVSVSADFTENDVTFRMKEYVRRGCGMSAVPSISDDVAVPRPLTNGETVQHEEMQYLGLVRRILEQGIAKGDRTGVGTISLFGAQMRFNLRESFPLLTTKRVFWRGVAEELLWFIKGSTNANLLAEKGVRIWDDNGSRKFLDERGFVDRDVGDLGPVYGFQWRHFGAKYKDMYADYTGQGVDQLAEVISMIEKNPNDRRIVLTAWNPSMLSEMALPPCHMTAQFYVANGELSCQMYQRSCDMGLGVPFNIASYALLTCLIAKVTGLKPGDFVHVLGDAHVYSNHVEALKEQLQRTPRAFPTLQIKDRDCIDAFTIDDLTLCDYHPHKSISMKMAV